MATIILQGKVTDDGHLEVELPPDFPPGDVEVEIRRSELQGVTLQQIRDSGLVGIWKDRPDIEDSVEYARELRRRASRRNQTP